MSTEMTNRAVAEYRRIALARAKLELDDAVLAAVIPQLSVEEFKDYVGKTDAIDEAIEEKLTEGAYWMWSDSTLRQRVATAAKEAGLDRAKDERV